MYLKLVNITILKLPVVHSSISLQPATGIHELYPVWQEQLKLPIVLVQVVCILEQRWPVLMLSKYAASIIIKFKCYPQYASPGYKWFLGLLGSHSFTSSQYGWATSFLILQTILSYLNNMWVLVNKTKELLINS